MFLGGNNLKENSNKRNKLLLSIKKWLQDYKYKIISVLYFGVIVVCIISALVLQVTSECNHSIERKSTTENKEYFVSDTEYSISTSVYSSDTLMDVTDSEICTSETELSEANVDSISIDSVDTSASLDIPLSIDLQEYIYGLATENNIPYELIIAIIDVESNFDSNAISSTNDYGLCQINISNHRWLQNTYGITDFLDPYQNVLCCVKMLSCYGIPFDNVYNIKRVLMCYNMGAGTANSYWASGVFSTSYTDEIIYLYEYYSNQ